MNFSNKCCFRICNNLNELKVFILYIRLKIKLGINCVFLNCSRNVKEFFVNRLDRNEIVLIYKMVYGNDIMNVFLKF